MNQKKSKPNKSKSKSKTIVKNSLSLEKKQILKIINSYQADPFELLSILRDVQSYFRCIPKSSLNLIAESLKIHSLQVEGTASFYHFLSFNHRGHFTLYLNTSVTSEMHGSHEILRALENEIGISIGSTTKDGLIGLYSTSCIGMCDQEPSALINFFSRGKSYEYVLTQLTPEKVKHYINAIKTNKIHKMLSLENENSTHTLIPKNVQNPIRKTGPVFFTPYTIGQSLQKAFKTDPIELIEIINKSNLRGRGGAGFPTGTKWGYARATASQERYVICNADEGEPGTFKDRTLLTELPKLIFEGMVLAGYAIGSQKGILYLRGEYAYLKNYLESVLSDMRKDHLLGKKILGSHFDFDIQLKLGAGAYICGEESALIESAEGKRGQPRNRPPFPVVSGYKNHPTIVNNPETLICALKIVLNGSDWFKKMGTSSSTGVKLLSLSGDCHYPGIYEVEWGLSIEEILQLCGAKDTLAVQIGGPSGICISEGQFHQKLCYSDLSTGGAITIFNKSRDLFSILHNYMEFFVNESCGFCVPCRAGNTLLLQLVEKLIHGYANQNDLIQIKKLGSLVKSTSRCGLGQTSPNPLLTTLENFKDYFNSRVKVNTEFESSFNIEYATRESCQLAKRRPYLRE